MNRTFGGPAIFLDRSDINTDEIIPARYLTEVTKDALKPFLLEDLTLEGFDPQGEVLQQAAVIITRKNFGCGSSREHAPWALEVNGIYTVIAEGYARIFRQNMFNCGMLAIELPTADIDRLFIMQQKGAVSIQVDLNNHQLIAKGAGQEESFDFPLTPFDKALVEAGGWVEFADARY